MSFQLEDLDHAVGAAFTFLTRNPGHDLMSENIQFYSKQPNFKPEMIKNLEVEDFQVINFV